MTRRRAATLIGMLVALLCLLVLAVVALSAINKAMTGAGSTLRGTAASHQDRLHLLSLFQSLAVQAQMHEGSFLVPSELTGRRDPRDDTTAGFFSAMIAGRYAVPEQLISSTEINPYVWADDDYDHLAYDPAADVHWDPAFTADLETGSNDSFAHVPLYGRRLRQTWRFTAGHLTPLLGSRGPKDGVNDPTSYTFGQNGRWAGHLVYGDGHVQFLETFTPPGVVYLDGGQALPDNVFRMEEGPDGLDAILTFTKEMTGQGPVIQHD